MPVEMLRDKKRVLPMLDVRVLGAAAFLFGLLYIPAFVYGTFWLWVFPFTALVTLFLRALTDHAIERVSVVGDAAKQAKAMIPEFIKMNVIMTVLLSVPFVAALWLSHEGYIQVITQSDTDKELWKVCLWILRDLDALGQIKYANVQILLSNIFFLIVGTLALLTACFKKIKQLFFILFHRESYKFLQDTEPAVGKLRGFIGLISIGAYFIVILMPVNPAPAVLYSVAMCVFICFLVFGGASSWIYPFVISQIRFRTL